MTDTKQVNIYIPEKLQPFLTADRRIKVAYGGRNGGKSWGIAMMLLMKGSQNPIKILCLRETMNSIKDSVHETLTKQIIRLGLIDYYTVERNAIYGQRFPNGERTEFLFKGIKRDVDQIRSTEGVHITWVEEAHGVSRKDWRVLQPTIFRRSKANGDIMDSELWISFNPQYAEDETYKRWVLNPPPGESLVTKINYDDLPDWVLPKGIKQEIEFDRLINPDEFAHVWLGECKKHLEGAVYEKELRLAEREHFIREFSKEDTDANAKYPVEAYWDIGREDFMVTWVAQRVGKIWFVIDYMEAQGDTIASYANHFRFKPYQVHKHWLPHDARRKVVEAELSAEEQLAKIVGREHVDITPNIDLMPGINALREIFPLLRFDSEKCHEGLEHLRKYHWDVKVTNEGFKRFSDVPVHDEHSHCADALRYMAVANGPREVAEPLKMNFARTIGPISANYSARNRWMGL